MTACYHTNSGNLICNFLWVYGFLVKNLSDFVSLPWKLDNAYYHNICIYILQYICEIKVFWIVWTVNLVKVIFHDFVWISTDLSSLLLIASAELEMEVEMEDCHAMYVQSRFECVTRNSKLPYARHYNPRFTVNNYR